MSETRIPPSSGMALQILPSSTRPALFEPWPDDVKHRCRDIWSSIGNRNAGRVEWLYGREVPENVAIPAAVTIRQWAREECWGTWADVDLAETHGRTLRELRTGWLAALKLSQETLIDSMCGRLDELPHAGDGRIKAAEVTLRVIAQSGLLAVAPEPDLSEEMLETMTSMEQHGQLREEIVRNKRGGKADRGSRAHAGSLGGPYLSPFPPHWRCRSGGVGANLMTENRADPHGIRESLVFHNGVLEAVAQFLEWSTHLTVFVGLPRSRSPSLPFTCCPIYWLVLGLIASP